MAVLPIYKYGDPVLRAKAQKVEQFDNELKAFVEDMFETMQDASGIGLAAPQVGVSKSLCVVEVGLIEEGKAPAAFVNPIIHERFGEKITLEEGCLSIPDINEKVTRDDGIRLTYQTIEGEEVELTCQGMLARVLQHEIDHLNGVFFTDHLGSMKLKMLQKKLSALQFEAQKEMIERKKAGQA